MKGLLTEDKLTRFATYQTAMLSATSDATRLGLAAYQKGGTDPKKFQNAMAGDDRAAKVAAAAQAALAKSGLTQDEVGKLSRVASAYYARGYVLLDAGKRAEEVNARIETAKAKGKEPSPVDVAMAKAHADQASRFETVRKEFAARYGQDALTLMQKHEPEFFEINKQMMGAAMSGMVQQR